MARLKVSRQTLASYSISISAPEPSYQDDLNSSDDEDNIGPSGIRAKSEYSQGIKLLSNNSPDIDKRKKLLQEYVKYKDRQVIVALILFGCGVVLHLSLNPFFSQPIGVGWLVVFAGLIFLAFVRNFLLQYRVKKGWFGTNKYEATELLRFYSKKRFSV